MKRRKTVLTILGAIVASSLLSIGCNKTNADQGDLNPSGNCSEGSCSFPGRYAGGQTGSSKCRGSGVYQNENMNQQNMNAPNQGPASGQGQGQMGGSNMGNNPNMMGGTRGYAPNQGPSSNQEPSQMGDSNMMMMRKPNPLNIERIKGEVIDKKSTNNGSGASLVMIVLRTPNEDVKVILGPSSYLDRSRLGLQIGDTVEIKGSRMQVNGTEMMIASEISKGGNLVPLRNEQGNPSWQDGSGMMPQQQPYRYNSGMMPQQQPYRYDNNYNTNGSGYYYNNYNYDANRGGNYYNQGCSSGRCGQQY